jgi:predicted GNAT family N-acyltransferase
MDEIKEANTIPDFIDAIRLHVEVFIKEQGFQPGWEPDEDDKHPRHFIATEQGTAVAACRFSETAPGELKIERMAVAKEHRANGIGRVLLERIIEEIKKQHPMRIWLRSRVRSQFFYEKCGFRPISAPFDLYGVQHVDMGL